MNEKKILDTKSKPNQELQKSIRDDNLFDNLNLNLNRNINRNLRNNPRPIDEEINELIRKKEPELIEKQNKLEIQKELKSLENNQFPLIEKTKKYEMDKLQIEKEFLRQKESQLEKDLEDYMDDLKNKEIAQSDKYKNKNMNQNDISGNPLDNQIIRPPLKNKNRLMELSKKKAESMFKIKQKKAELEGEYQKVIDNLDKIQDGDLHYIKRNKTRVLSEYQNNQHSTKIEDAILNPDQKAKLLQDQERINNLKRGLNDLYSQKLNPIDPYDLERHKMTSFNYPQEVKNLINRISDQDDPEKVNNKLNYINKKTNPFNQYYRPNNKDIKSPVEQFEDDYNKTEPLIQRKSGPKSRSKTPINFRLNAQNFTSQPISNPIIQNPNTFLPPINPYNFAQNNPYNFPYFPFSPYQGLPFQNPFSPYLYNPNYPINLPKENNSNRINNNPELEELKEKIRIGEQKAKELEDELENLKLNKANPPNKPPVMPINNLRPVNMNTKLSELEPEEISINNLQAQEYDDINVLNSLDPNSELFKHKLEQFKERSAYRAEVQRALQAQRLDRIRRDYNLDLLNKMGLPPSKDANPIDFSRQKFQREFNHRNIFNKNRLVYNKADGFKIYFDIFKNPPLEMKKLEIVYSMFTSGTSLRTPMTIEAVDEFQDNILLIGKSHVIKDVNPNKELRIVMEIQGLDSEKNEFVIGWTCIDIFDASGRLKTGLFRLPILSGTTLTNNLDYVHLKTISRKEFNELLIRIGFAQLDYLHDIPVDSSMENNYFIPDLLLEDAELRNPINNPLNNTSNLPSNYFATPSKPYPPTQKGFPLQNKEPPRDPGNINRSDPKSGNNLSPKDLKGLNIHLFTIKNCIIKRPFIVEATIFEDQRPFFYPDGKKATLIYPKMSYGVSPTGQNVELGSPSDIASSNMIPFNREEEVLGNFCAFRRSNPAKPNFYLLLQFFEEVTNSETSNQKSLLFSYFTVTMLNNTDDTFRLGDRDLRLFELPVEIPPKRGRTPTNMLLSITIDDYKGISVPRNLNSKPENKEQGSKKRNDKPVIDNRLFIENKDPNLRITALNINESIEIYIDELRFVPLNASICRIRLTTLRSDLIDIKANLNCYPDPSSSLCEQKYKSVLTIPNAKSCPDLFVFGSLETIDKSVNLAVNAGFILIFPIYSMETRAPYNGSLDNDFGVLEGNFQIPVFYDNPFLRNHITFNLMEQLERIPCSSVLIRIKKSANNIKNMPVAPPYDSGSFNTMLVNFAVADVDVMKERKYKTQINILEEFERIKPILNPNFAKKQSIYPDSFDQFVAIPDRYSILDPTFYDSYNANMGLIISIEMVHNLLEKSSVLVICTTNPSNNLPNNSIEKVIVFYKLNLNSCIYSPEFAVDFISVPDFNLNNFPILYFKVYKVTPSQGNLLVDELGWTFLPILKLIQNETYILTGSFILPLFNFPVIKQTPKNNNDNLIQKLILKTRSDVLVKLIEPTSLIVRIKNSKYKGLLYKKKNFGRYNKDAIPVEKLAIYDYNPEVASKIENEPKVSEVLPQDQEMTYIKKLQDILVKSFGVPTTAL